MTTDDYLSIMPSSWWSVQLLAGVCIILWLLRLILSHVCMWRHTLDLCQRSGIPMAPRNFPWGQLREVLSHRAQNEHLKARWSRQYGRIFIVFIGPIPVLHCADPDMMEDILANECHYGPSPILQFALTSVFGMPVIPGMMCPKTHHDARQAIKPVFYPPQITRAIVTAREETQVLLREWDKKDPDDTSHDLAQDLRHLTSTSFASFLFHLSSEQAQVFASQRVVALVQTLMENLALYLVMGLLPLGKIIFPVMLRSKFELIRQKKDRLHTILRGQKVHLSHLEHSPEAKTSAVASLFLSVDSMTTLVACCLIELAKRPEWQVRLRTEILEAKQHQPQCSPEIIRGALDEMNWFIYEVLRVYALIPGNLRIVKTTRPLCGKYSLPPGLAIRLMFKPMSVNPDLWHDDPLEFNPLRFQHGVRKATTHRCAFIPFGSGKRNCMGRHVVMYQTKAKLAVMLEHYSFALPTGARVDPSDIECPTLPNVMKKLHFKLHRLSSTS